MNTVGPSKSNRALKVVLGIICAAGCVAGIVATLVNGRHRLGPLPGWVPRSVVDLTATAWTRFTDATDAHDHAECHDHGQHDHDHHDHGHHDHDHDHDHQDHGEENSIAISEQARRSIGLREGDIVLSTFQRTITVPGMVVERRGRSRFTAIAPMTGYLTRILVTEGESVAPEQPLFEVRITHEELVGAQTDLLRTTAEIDVVRREIGRLEGIGPEGLIASKVILERKYELQRLEAVQLAQRQALLLHGLTESQVEAIVADRRLLGSLIVRAPGPSGVEEGKIGRAHV